MLHVPKGVQWSGLMDVLDQLQHGARGLLAPPLTVVEIGTAHGQGVNLAVQLAKQVSCLLGVAVGCRYVRC